MRLKQAINDQFQCSDRYVSAMFLVLSARRILSYGAIKTAQLQQQTRRSATS